MRNIEPPPRPGAETSMDRLVREYDMLPPGITVVCAVSGGADSMCLLHRLWSRAKAEDCRLCAAHFDHGLRGEESRRDAAFVEAWCRQREIPFYLGSAHVAEEARARKQGVEETARALRYAFLEETAQAVGAARIATAHNADDNAETLLLNLVRGAGLQGLAGIRPRRGKLIRPLLTTPRAEILAYLKAHGVPHVEDSTNADIQYARNKLRHQVIPVLRELNPRLTETLTADLAHLRGDNDCLDALARRAVDQAVPVGEDGLSLPAWALAGLPRPIALRGVRLLFAQLGEHDFRAAHLEAVADLCRSQDPSARLDLPHGLGAWRQYDRLILARRQPASGPPEVRTLDAAVPLTLQAGGWSWSFRPAQGPEDHPKTPDRAFLALSKIQGRPVLRPRRSGDAITLPHRPRKTLKKLFIDAKLPRTAREQMLLLADDAGVLYVPGFGPDAAHLAAYGEAAWEIAACPILK